MTTTSDVRRSSGVPVATADHTAANRWLALGALVCLLVGVVGGLWLGRDRPPSQSSVDVGFLQDMTVHHDQAVQMASIAVDGGVDDAVLPFALEVIKSQRWELGRMYTWLEEWGYALDDPEERLAMGWMGHPVPISAMAGMQSEADLDRLIEGPEDERSRLFLELMIDHHRGAVHMAEYAAEHAGTAKVRELAVATAVNQAAEIREYEMTLERLAA